MIVFCIIAVLAAIAGILATGWVVGIFPLGFALAWLIKQDKSGQAMDTFFALCFFGGIAAILIQIGRSLAS